jgi:transposase
MSKKAAVIELSAEEKEALERWVRSGSTPQRLVERSRIILRAGEGCGSVEIADELGTRPARVSKWRTRFARQRLAALQDAPRTGRPRRYDGHGERRILELLDQPPPAGFARWNGGLLSEQLKDVSHDEVWRVLRRRRISLARRRSWCISTDPQFAAKAADIVGLYLNPLAAASRRGDRRTRWLWVWMRSRRFRRWSGRRVGCVCPTGAS